MLDKTPASSTPTSFRETHCMKCRAGFVRTTTQGATVVICLVDREPILVGITSCNKYETKEAKQAN